eukprot:1019430-Prymnesium_polylepis.1
MLELLELVSQTLVDRVCNEVVSARKTGKSQRRLNAADRGNWRPRLNRACGRHNRREHEQQDIHQRVVPHAALFCARSSPVADGRCCRQR